MKAKMIKSLLFKKQVRLFFVDNTSLLQEILDLNKNGPPIVQQMLGEFLSGYSILSAILKGEQRLSVTIVLSNRKYQLFIDTDASGNVRGYANQDLLNLHDQEFESIQELIGPKASMLVIKGSHMNQFTSITDMPFKNIDENLTHYFKQSEQIETYIETHIEMGKQNRVMHSCALFAQLLPGASPSLLEEIKKRLSTKDVFFKKLKEMDRQGLSEALKDYFDDIEIIGEHTLQFSCDCSKEMFYGFLQSMDRKELIETMNANQSIDSRCHICGKTYHFYPEEVKAFFNQEMK
jgi:molecular chaperone Hsp33